MRRIRRGLNARALGEYPWFAAAAVALGTALATLPAARAETATERYIRTSFPASYKIWKPIQARMDAARAAFETARKAAKQNPKSRPAQQRLLVARRVFWRATIEWNEGWLIHWLTVNIDRQQKAIAAYTRKIASRKAKIQKLETTIQKRLDLGKVAFGNQVRKSYQALYPAWVQMSKQMHTAKVGLWKAEVAQEQWFIRWSAQVIENSKKMIAGWKEKIANAKKRIAMLRAKLVSNKAGAAAEAGGAKAPAVAAAPPVSAKPRTGLIATRVPAAVAAIPRGGEGAVVGRKTVSVAVETFARGEGIVAGRKTVSEVKKPMPSLRIAGSKRPVTSRGGGIVTTHRLKNYASAKVVTGQARRSSEPPGTMRRTAGSPASGLGARGRLGSLSAPKTCTKTGPWSCRKPQVVRFEVKPGARVNEGQSVTLLFEARDHERAVIDARDPTGRLLRVVYRKTGLTGASQRGSATDRPTGKTLYRFHVWNPAQKTPATQARSIEWIPKKTGGGTAASAPALKPGDIRVTLKMLRLRGFASNPKSRSRPVASTVTDPYPSICRADSECNNQNYSGVCLSGRCRTVVRGACTSKGTVQICIDPFTGRHGAQTCHGDGVNRSRWSDCIPRTYLDTSKLD